MMVSKDLEKSMRARINELSKGNDCAAPDKKRCKGKTLKKSRNDYDWLGHGIYFWENSVSRAIEWAEKSSSIKEPAVIGAFINLGHCLNLLDYECIQQVKVAYELLCAEFDRLNKTIPTNSDIKDEVSFNRQLDCQVMLRLHKFNEDRIRREFEEPGSDIFPNPREIRRHDNYYDSVRGMFPEGAPLYEKAGFREKNHIQICVRNPNCILGYFEPKKQNSTYRKLW